MIIKLGPKTISIPSARLPRFNIPQFKVMSWLSVPIPKALRVGGAKMGLTSLVVVAIGFAGTIFMVIAGTNTEILWPEAGAEYNLPSVVGNPLPPDPETPALVNQTLRINLADNVRLDKLHLKNLDLGKASLTNAFQINRSTGVTGAMVNVGVFTITNSSAPSLDWANMEIGTLTMGAKTDGHTNSAVINSTISNLVVDSDRGSGSYVAENSVVDRVIINLNGDNGATIGEIIVDDVDASVGAWDWDYLRIGTLVIDGTNQFGTGDGIGVPDFIINDTVKSRSITDNLVDTPLKVQ
jgi:hypothetical protein